MKILKVQGMTNNGSYALIHVLMEDGLEAEVYVGGDCETYHHHGKNKAFVKRPLQKGLTKDSISDKI